MEEFTKKQIKQLFWNSSKEDRAEIKKNLNELLQKFKIPPNEWTLEDHNKLKMVVNEFVRSGISPGFITHMKLDNDEVALARLNHVFHKAGYTGGDKPNVEKVNSKMALDTKGYDDKIINLQDRFGLMDEKYSTTDFGVFRKPNGDTHIVFRGSKTNPFKNPEFSEDWGYNARASFLDAKKTNKYSRILNDLGKVIEDPEYNVTRMVGYSLGGGLAMNMGEEFGVDSVVFNPHINKTHDFNEFKQKHLIIRTNADPASVMSQGRTNNVDIKTIPTTINSEDGLSAHELSQLTDTTTERSRRFKLMTRLQTHNRLREFANQLDDINEAIKRKGETLKAFLSRPAKRPRGAYRQVPTEEGFELQPPEEPETSTTRRSILSRVEDRRLPQPLRARRPRGAYRQVPTEEGFELQPPEEPETSRTRQVFDIPSSEVRSRPPLLRARRPSGAFPPERRPTRIARVLNVEDRESINNVLRGMTTGMRGKIGIGSRALAWLASNPRAKVNPEEIPLLQGDESGLSSDQAVRFANSDPEVRTGTRNYLDQRINASYSDIDTEYMAPMRNSARLGGFNFAAGGAAAVAGLGTGALSDFVMNKLGVDKNLPSSEKDFIEGSVSSAAGEIGAMKVAGLIGRASGNSAASALQVLSSTGMVNLAAGAVGGGVGMVVTNVTTDAVKKLFGDNANIYTKDIVSNLVGSEVGYAAGLGATYLTGLAVTGGATALAGVAEAAGLGTAAAGAEAAGVAGTLATIGAADAWNPIGWAALIGAGIVGAVAAGTGYQQAKQEEKERTKEALAYAAAVRQHHELIDMATTEGGELNLRQQYTYIIDYLKSIGASARTIADAQNELQGKLNNNDGALDQEGFRSTFHKYLSQFNLGLPSRNLQTTINQQFTARASTMTNLISRLKEQGIDVKPVPQEAYLNSTNFIGYYNNIIAGLSPEQRNKLGIKELPNPENPFNIYGNQLTNLVKPHDPADEGILDPKLTSITQALQFRSQIQSEEDFFKDKPNLANQVGFTQFYQQYQAEQTAEQTAQTGIDQSQQELQNHIKNGKLSLTPAERTKMTQEAHQAANALAANSREIHNRSPYFFQNMLHKHTKTLSTPTLSTPTILNPPGENYVKGQTLSTSQIAGMTHFQIMNYLAQQAKGKTITPTNKPTAPAPATNAGTIPKPSGKAGII